MIPRKIDLQSANAIKSILKKMDIHNSRVLIDLDKQTVESHEENYSIDNLLEAAGALSPQRGKELLEEVNRSREEWD